ncbi:MAG: hypothetical protein ACOCXG_02850 [Nanoarchaeota archaeon]
MEYKKQRKGAVEMSLNLIIMLIIGMVVLGLIIGFVSQLVSRGTEGFDKQLGDNEKLKLEEVGRCPDNLCINPSPSISVDKGGKTNIFIKVRGYSTGGFSGDNAVQPGMLENEGTLTLTVSALDTAISTNPGVSIAGPGFDVAEGDDQAQMYTLNVAKSVPVGTYYLKLTLNDEITKTLTLEVE